MLSKLRISSKKSKTKTKTKKSSPAKSQSRTSSKAAAAASPSRKKMSPKSKVLFTIFHKKSFSEKVDEINELLSKFDEHINKIDEMNGDKMTPQLEKQRNDLINSKFLMLDGLSKLTNQYTRKLKHEDKRRSRKGGAKNNKTQKKKRI